MNDITVSILKDDGRFDTLILESENFGKIGYSLDNRTGELERVCICEAWEPNECVCGAWDNVEGYDD